MMISLYAILGGGGLMKGQVVGDTLTEVTVVETRRQHAVRSAAPLHVVEHQDWLRRGVSDMADALHRLPGITLRDYGGAGGMKTVCVRGFGTKHTGVSYDGLMLSDCQSGETDLSRYGIENVDYVQLTIGDNEDIFIPARQAAMPAVLSIQTMKAPTASLPSTGGAAAAPSCSPLRGMEGTVGLKVGSFGYVSPFLRYGLQLSPTLSVSAAGDYTYAENDYPYQLKNVTITMNDRRANSRMSAGHGEVGFLWATTPHSRLGGKVYYFDSYRQLPGPARYYTNLSGESLKDRNFFGQLTYQSRLTEMWSVKGGAKFNWTESVYRDALYAGGINDASYWQREGYATAALLFTPSGKWAFDYSADYALNNLNGSSWRTVVGRPYRHSVLQSATAKYRAERLTATARLLYSLYLNDAKEGPSARNMRRLSPSLSAAFRLLPEHELYARVSYKNIFRTPTFNESYYYHYGSTDLLPEVTDQLNLGLTYMTPQDGPVTIRTTLDGYHNHIKDMIVSVPYNMFVWTCVNVGKVQVLGLDATLDVCCRLNERHRLTVAGNYSYQQAENRSNKESPYYGNQIAYIPLHSGAASLSYENPWLNITLHGHGVGDRWANNEHYEESMVYGYADYGLTLYRSFRWGRHRIEGRFDIKNLLDEQYEIVANYPMPGRSYMVSVKVEYGH